MNHNKADRAEVCGKLLKVALVRSVEGPTRVQGKLVVWRLLAAPYVNLLEIDVRIERYCPQ